MRRRDLKVSSVQVQYIDGCESGQVIIRKDCCNISGISSYSPRSPAIVNLISASLFYEWKEALFCWQMQLITLHH